MIWYDEDKYRLVRFGWPLLSTVVSPHMNISIKIRSKPWLRWFFPLLLSTHVSVSLNIWEHCIRAPSKHMRYWEIHPRRPSEISLDPRDFLRPQRFTETWEISPWAWSFQVSRYFLGVGDGSPNTSQVLMEYGHSLIINLSTGTGSGNPSLWTGKSWQC